MQFPALMESLTRGKSLSELFSIRSGIVEASRPQALTVRDSLSDKTLQCLLIRHRNLILSTKKRRIVQDTGRLARRRVAPDDTARRVGGILGDP